MNYPSFNEYLIGLKPTWSGIVSVVLCLFAIPFFADLFLVTMSFRKGDSISVSLPLLNGYLRAIPYYLFYLVVYFFILNTWNFIIKKSKLETFYFGS